MEIYLLAPDTLWQYYQKGYHCLVRNGLYFRQVLRPALSHVYFQRAVPLLLDYAKANRGKADLPPEFGDQMQSCPLTPRDLLHLDYAISLGYAEIQVASKGAWTNAEVLEWPGPGGMGLFIAADAPAPLLPELPDFDEEMFDLDDDLPEDPEDENRGGHFDL